MGDKLLHEAEAIAAEAADATGLLLAEVATDEQNGRWTEGRLYVAPRGFRWRTVGRSRHAGESDLVRDETAGDLATLRRRAKRTALLFEDALAVLVNGRDASRRADGMPSRG